MKRAFIPLLLAAGLLGSAPAWATSLAEVLSQARAHDAEWQAAEAASATAGARRDQARALWLPNVSATAMAGRMSSRSEVQGASFAAPGLGQHQGVAFDTSVRDGNGSQWNVSATQPVWSGERLAQSRALGRQAELAEAQWRLAREQALVRAAGRWFELITAQEGLRLANAQSEAARQAREQARERFAAGDVAVTETHEAQARAAALQAQVLAAQGRLALARAALGELTGMDEAALSAPAPAQHPGLPQAGDLATWQQGARNDSPELAIARAQAAAAEQDARRQGWLAGPSIDLVARSGRDQVNGNGDFGAASTGQRSSVIGVQLSIPVFTGGMRSARGEEARAQARAAQAQLDGALLSMARRVHAAWLGVTVGTQRVMALEDALRAGRDREEATSLAREVGDRTLLDLLNAQNERAAAEISLVEARLQVWTDYLQLAMLAGRLDETLAADIDRALIAGNGVTGKLDQ